MCDVKKYEKIYEDIQKLQPEDTLQLVLEAETEEQSQKTKEQARTVVNNWRENYGRSNSNKRLL